MMLNKIHRFFFNLLFKTFYINQQTGEVKDKEGNVIDKYDKC
jgi:hypothetical protein